MGLFKQKGKDDASLKQVIIIRQDLKLPKGKAAAQAAHASVEAVLASSRTIVDAWHSQGMKKIVVKAVDEAHMHQLAQLARAHKIIARTITDAGKTVVAPGTLTAMALGPDDEDLIDRVTGQLPMY